MIIKIKNGLNLIQNMGFGYIKFRVQYELKLKTGMLTMSYPTGYSDKLFISLNDWQQNAPSFFFNNRNELQIPSLSNEAMQCLAHEFEAIKNGKIKFFNAFYLDIARHDWVTNPSTKASYLPLQHWTKIKDLDTQKGDIKFVWEKSRFSYLYTIIRYDYHFKQDNSQLVFEDIISWIDSNPGNMGPNFKCSQEISLRILNWTFALYFYKNSPSLTNEIFTKIISAIHSQLLHVESNINFSRIAVRNNHAITECLMLYLGGILFPFFKEANRWKEKGKKYVIEEGLYQIYEDGSYLQFSMNYHRVMIQLFTWFCFLTKKHNESIPSSLLDRIKKANNFLYQHQDLKSGWLPNHGANDGALFFKLSSLDYRDYRPQINALHYYFNNKMLYNDTDVHEDVYWYTNINNVNIESKKQDALAEFNIGGYYVLRNIDSFCSIKCGSYKDRPSQADNLHIDIWSEGKNIIRDNGSYKYNTEADLIKYFAGTASHNTIQIGDLDQMKKGGRFIWYNWSKALKTTTNETETSLSFDGECNVYSYLNKNIIHQRKVTQFKDKEEWIIEDTLSNISNINYPIKQLWHVAPYFEEEWKIECFNEKGDLLPSKKIDAWHSAYYGLKEKSSCIYFENPKGIFTTKISKK